jgi:predicted flap endonuclease-1-like 5' DNA nuclease
MPLVQCTLGPATTPIMGWTYVFERDRFDRYVAKVDNDDHIAILTSVYCYVVVPDEPEVKASAPALTPKPKKAAPAAPVEPVAPVDPAPAAAREELGLGQAVAQTADPDPDPPVEPTKPEAAAAPASPVDPLDHDSDGKKGGSVAKAKPPVLTDIKGIGAKLAEKLVEFGVETVKQIAEMTDQDAAAMDELLSLNGRITREKWVEQAAALLAG